jgi:hypothetical protein
MIDVLMFLVIFAGFIATIVALYRWMRREV